MGVRPTSIGAGETVIPLITHPKDVECLVGGANVNGPSNRTMVCGWFRPESTRLRKTV